MEQLKHSEEEILKLGKKLITELKLENTVNTLARWMAHYLAELIYNIDNCDSEKEKAELKKECCKIILELWEKRERVPIQKPLDKLKPIIEVLELLKKQEYPFFSHRFINRVSNTKDEKVSLKSFLEIVKENSTKIYRKSLASMIDETLLDKSNEWLEKHENFLSNEEKEIIAYLNSQQEIIIEFNEGDKKVISEKDKKEKLLEELKNLIDEQKLYYLLLKKEMLE